MAILWHDLGRYQVAPPRLSRADPLASMPVEIPVHRADRPAGSRGAGLPGIRAVWKSCAFMLTPLDEA